MDLTQGDTAKLAENAAHDEWTAAPLRTHGEVFGHVTDKQKMVFNNRVKLVCKPPSALPSSRAVLGLCLVWLQLEQLGVCVRSSRI